MGLAKHHEEILEIVFERMDMMKARKCELEIQAVYAVQNTPLTKVSVEIHDQWYVDLPKPKAKPEDQYITCLDCGEKFLFSVRSQKYFADKKWNAPKRCKHCRDYRNYKNVRHLMCPSF